MRKFTLLDGSAFLTGLLVGMAMPPGVSPFIPASASLFAVVIVKEPSADWIELDETPPSRA